jgi:hypothetical protein
MHRIEWFDPVWDVFQDIPLKDQVEVVEVLNLVRSFPAMFPLRRRGRMRGHRAFVARRRWLVFYKVVDGVIYVRALWPARAKPL